MDDAIMRELGALSGEQLGKDANTIRDNRSTYAIIVVSKDDTFMLGDDKQIRYLRDLYGDNDDYHGRLDIINISHNSKPLTQVYNEQLEHYRTNKYDREATDFVIFMHGDVKVDVAHMLNHIEECKGRYDIMGLCGCSKISVSQSPLNWFCGSRPFPTERWGCVTHGELSNATSFFNHHTPNATDHEVACIDGLCIIFGRKALDSGIKFDEQFKFDQYDTDISFQAVLKYGLRLGVIVEPSLQHYSVGKSILSDDFLTHEMDFRRKWKLDVPPGSKLEQLMRTRNCL